jgi:hypothetical protein
MPGKSTFPSIPSFEILTSVVIVVVVVVIWILTSTAVALARHDNIRLLTTGNRPYKLDELELGVSKSSVVGGCVDIAARPSRRKEAIFWSSCPARA